MVAKEGRRPKHSSNDARLHVQLLTVTGVLFQPWARGVRPMVLLLLRGVTQRTGMSPTHGHDVTAATVARQARAMSADSAASAAALHLLLEIGLLLLLLLLGVVSVLGVAARVGRVFLGWVGVGTGAAG